MKKLGFFQSLYDRTLYSNTQGIYIAVYVDNLHIVRPDFSLINKLKAHLVSKFVTKDLGLKAYYLEMEVSQEDEAITVTQMIFINQLLGNHQMSNYNSASTTILEGLCLAPAHYDFNPDPKDDSIYKQFTGSAQWLACQT